MEADTSLSLIEFMKIKNQFKFLITGIIIVPALCIILLPLYHYFSSPQRFLLKGYNEIRNVNSDSMTENEWNELKEQLKHVPPRMQTTVFIDNTAFISSIPEIKEGSTFSSKELFEFIRNTSENYEYQFQSPNRRYNGKREKKPAFIVLLRANVEDRNRKIKFSESFYYPAFILFAIFEIFAIAVSISISRTISSSITFLEENTQRIANGDLEIELKSPQKGKYSNEITSLTNNLEKLRLSLKENEERKSRFIMGVSHDLRTPVALIKGYTEAITDGIVSGSENINKSLEIIHSKSEQLELMVNELLNYVRLSNQDFRKNMANENLYDFLLNYCKEMELAGSAFKRNFLYEINIPENLSVHMDKNLLTRVLENLANNALRYTNDNDTIKINSFIKGTDAVIQVIDSGKGIGLDEKEHIFDLFYRASNSRREQGMGIGLSVVKSIIDSHDWKIQVDSEKGSGSTFSIIIPLKN